LEENPIVATLAICWIIYNICKEEKKLKKFLSVTMKSYPGRAKKVGPVAWPEKSLPRDIHARNVHDQHDLHHGKRGHGRVHHDHPGEDLAWGDEDVLEALGEETSDIFLSSSPIKKSKKSNQSSTRIRRSSSLENHSKPVLSRREILASLEENSFEKILLSSSPALSAESPCSWLSISSSHSTPNSFCNLTGESKGVFSRTSLIQSLSREESRQGLGSAGDTESNSESSEDDDDVNQVKVNCCEEDVFLSDPLRASSPCPGPAHVLSPHQVSLDSLSWVATLGVGGFGRVELVTAGAQKIPFALKKMKKTEIKDTKQRQHILNEKLVMENCSSPFIVQLFQTFQDSRYLYMLMEPCLGGELWTILRNSKRFTDNTARFYVACVILAFDYLHDKAIIYRDLKPENLLLDRNGYIKLTDFGFAKQLGVEGKAWTFCGTPEYVAPEIITNKSHDYRADIWSIGILVFELLTGTPPFNNKANPTQVYPEILKGIRGVFFPNYITAPASEIIRQCCRLAPAQRPSLEILRHYVWFAGLDWGRMADRTLPPPSVPTITSTVDSSNFDSFKQDMENPEEDFSDWAENF